MGDGEPEDKDKAGVVRLSKEGLEVKVKEGESSDEEIEDLQHVAAATSAASGSSLYVSQPHQWEKVDFATFSWCKYCGKYLFPLSPGFACQRGCNYTVHKGKCMEAASRFDCYTADAQSRSRSGRPDSHLDTFQNQVGGHKGKAAFLKDLDGGKILKPLCPVEFQFYSVLAKLASSDHEGSGVTCEGIDEMKTRMGNVAVWEFFFPRFHGAAQTSEGDDSVTEHYIVMEDLTAGYNCPCICDLKIGARGYDDKASTKKILQQKLLCSVTTSSTLGFRMCGMQYWQNEQRSYVVRDKLWGCKLKENTMQGALVQFLDNGDGVRFPLILNWLAKMKRIEKWFEEQSLFHFYSSSILLIYEGSAPKDCTDQQVLKADVRMVDFAHTHPNTIAASTRDENYIHGLRGVIRMLEDILRPVLTPEMVQQLGYDPSAAHSHSEGEESDSGAPSSGSFDIRHLFRRRAVRAARPGESNDDMSASGGSFSDAERYAQLEDGEELETAVAEPVASAMSRRVASVPEDMVTYQRDDREEEHEDPLPPPSSSSPTSSPPPSPMPLPKRTTTSPSATDDPHRLLARPQEKRRSLSFGSPSSPKSPKSPKPPKSTFKKGHDAPPATTRPDRQEVADG